MLAWVVMSFRILQKTEGSPPPKRDVDMLKVPGPKAFVLLSKDVRHGTADEKTPIVGTGTCKMR